MVQFTTLQNLYNPNDIMKHNQWSNQNMFLKVGEINRWLKVKTHMEEEVE